MNNSFNNNFKNRVNNINKKVTAASVLIDGNSDNSNTEDTSLYPDKKIIRKTTSLTLDINLMTKAKIYALQNKKTMYEVFESALNEYLLKNNSKN